VDRGTRQISDFPKVLPDICQIRRSRLQSPVNRLDDQFDGMHGAYHAVAECGRQPLEEGIAGRIGGVAGIACDRKWAHGYSSALLSGTVTRYPKSGHAGNKCRMFSYIRFSVFPTSAFENKQHHGST
jgi:hypothetical protein